jgi:ubiquitin carboxyl-terminal hydrolase 4/11/15
MDHQGSPEPENGPSEEDEEEEEEADVGKGSRGVSAAPSRLFSFSMVNSYGTANISPLPCDGNVLKLNRESPPCPLL